MPPVKSTVSPPLTPSWPVLISRSSNVATSNFNFKDSSLAKKANDILKFALSYKIVCIEVAIGVIFLCVVVYCRTRPLRRDDIETIRSRRRQIRSGTISSLPDYITGRRIRSSAIPSRPDYILGEDGTQRNFTGMNVEGEEEALIDWTERPDPFYVQTEEAEARRHARMISQRSSRRTTQSSSRKSSTEVDGSRQAAESSSRKTSAESDYLIDSKPTGTVVRRPDFNLIQSSNSKADRYPSWMKPARAPERRENETSKTSGNGPRRIKVKKGTYPREDGGYGCFDTSGYQDLWENTHTWKGRRVGEKVASYEAALQSKSQAVKSRSSTFNYGACQFGESSTAGKGKAVVGKAVADQRESSSSVTSQSPVEAQKSTPPSELTSPTSILRDKLAMGTMEGHFDALANELEFRSISFAPGKFSQTPPSKIPTFRALSTANSPQPVRYTSGRYPGANNSPTSLVSPTKFTTTASPLSPTSFKTPVGASRYLGSPSATSPLLGLPNSPASGKSDGSSKTVIRRSNAGDK